jgi:hypothetical protein
MGTIVRKWWILLAVAIVVAIVVLFTTGDTLTPIGGEEHGAGPVEVDRGPALNPPENVGK